MSLFTLLYQSPIPPGPIAFSYTSNILYVLSIYISLILHISRQ